MAMYPFNKVSQYDKFINLGGRNGGFILFMPDTIKKMAVEHYTMIENSSFLWKIISLIILIIISLCIINI